MKTTFCFLALAMLFIACDKKTTVTTIKPDGTKVTTTVETPIMPAAKWSQANLNMIHEDMSMAEVSNVLGAPTSTRSEPIPIVGGTQTTYTYQSPNAAITIIFKNDRMKEKSGTFNP